VPGDETEAPAPEEQQVLPDTEENAAASPGEDDVQPTRQVTAGVSDDTDGELPFTGFAAIPVLLVGLGLLTGGMLMRRSSRTD
jgi:hypothetical protein